MATDLAENIINILSIARLAPSVHNTQPWKVKVEEDSLVILPAEERLLTYGDPTGRQAVICLGIFTEACRVALAAYGFKVRRVKMEDRNIRLIVTSQSSAGHNDSDEKLLSQRFTDRSIYKKTIITNTQARIIEDAWPNKRVEIRVVREPAIIERCAALTGQGLKLAMSSPDFRQELSEYLVPSKRTPYGIPLSTLQSGKLKALFIRQLINRGLANKQEAVTEYRRWRSAGALVFVLAAGDSAEYWLESGRAYLRASLAIQKLGLNQATSAAIVEASDFHEDIEKMLGTSKRIQCLMRIGQGRKRQLKSGRLAAESLLVT